ncbi:MAG: histidine phosphotransferase family protein [Alphaproteobacteria bacterium]
MDALRLASLLSSRLCHDLVGPASAVVNGLELVDMEGGSVDKEALDLVATSAAQVTTRLQIYRGAYGVAAGLTLADARKSAVAFFANSKVKLDWPDALPSDGLPPSASKLVLNMLLLGAELLGRGGRLAVVRDGPDVAVRVLGEAMRTEDLALLDTASGADDSVTPRNVQPFYLGRLAAAAGRRVAVASPAPGDLRLTLRGGD